MKRLKLIIPVIAVVLAFGANKYVSSDKFNSYKESIRDELDERIETKVDEFLNSEAVKTNEVMSDETSTPSGTAKETNNIDLNSIPEYSGDPYVVINDNNPNFTDEDLEKAKNSYEEYSWLDSLDRCGMAMASIGIDLMPTEKRGSIGSIKPSGWVTSKYDFIDGKYLYNRCHLIGYQLCGQNIVESDIDGKSLNLITGTRYLNVEGMLPFENMIANYVKDTNNHVLYRVTPMFKDNELVARGVMLEAKSVEDNGEGILFNIYCYNVQPGVEINYEDGTNTLKG